MSPQIVTRDSSRTRTARQATIHKRSARALKLGLTPTRSGRLRTTSA